MSPRRLGALIVFAPKGKVPPALSRLNCIGTAKEPAVNWVHLVTKEDEWGNTDFYCTTAALSAELERRQLRLKATVIYLPDMTVDFQRELWHRHDAGIDSRVRLAVPADRDTMPLLMPPPSLPMFDPRDLNNA